MWRRITIAMLLTKGTVAIRARVVERILASHTIDIFTILALSCPFCAALDVFE